MGKFITFEGGEGSGKSSVIKEISKWIISNGFSCLTVKDPGGTPIGEEIRAILLPERNKGMAKETELLLYLASRAELIAKLIKPNLNKYDFILCDRFNDSTRIYQGLIKGWDRTTLDFMHLVFSHGIKPYKTFLLDIPAKTGLARSKGFDKNESKWESEGLEVHERINGFFFEMACKNKERFFVVNSEYPLDEVVGTIQDLFISYIFNDRQVKARWHKLRTTNQNSEL